MARKSVTKSKPVTKIRKYQTGSIYQQVANPYYISGSYAEQAKLEAQKAIEAATKFGDYSQARAIEDEVRKKERARQEEQAVNETNQQIATQNSQEFQQTATESLTSGLDLLKKYRAAKAIKDAGLIANTAMQAGTAGTWAPIAATPSATSAGLNAGVITTGLASTPVTAAAPTVSLSAGSMFLPKAITSAATPAVNTLAPLGTTAASTATTAGTSLVPGAVVGGQVGSQAANAGSALGAGASIGTGLATAGVGLGLNLLGTAIEKGGDDNDFRTFDKRQARSNVLGEMTKTAGYGASIGGMFGLPGALIGGAGGLVVGGIKGLIENKKNKKIANEYKEEQDRIDKENEEYERKRQSAIRQQEQLLAASAQKGFTGSRLQGLNTGFGYATSTNMNTQPTSSFYGKTGGYRVPGGKVVPIGGDAVEFIGRKHSEGGIKLDPQTEVEHKETMKKDMKMADGGESDYFYSSDYKVMPIKGGKFLNYTGKSYADIHKAIERSNKPDYVKDIESRMLAKDQEATAYKRGEKDRNPNQIAKYGGIHKYQTGNVREEEESLLGNEVEIEGDAMGTWGETAVREDLSGVKPATTAEVSGVQTTDAVKDVDGKYKVKDANGNVIAESSDKNVAEKRAQNAAIATAADPDPAANPNKRRIYGMGRGDAASRKKYESIVMSPEDQLASRFARFEKEEGNEKGESMPNYGWNNLPAGEKQPTSIREATDLFQRTYGAKARALGITNPDVSSYIGDYMMNSNRKPEDFLLYASGKISLAQINSKDDLSKEWNANKDEILKNINSGKLDMGTLAKKRDDVLKTTRVLQSPTDPNDPDTAVFNPAYEATWKKRATLGLGYNNISGTKPPVTAEQAANAQSNANASNVTVRDQNQVNAQAPAAQTSVAPGGTTNNAGQAAADAAAKSGTQDSTATTTSTSGTPVTPSKERLFGKDDATKGGKGVSKSMEKVPAGQGDQGVYFGNVSNAQFDAFKANNPWFDFSAGFDPKKRDFTSAKGIKGSSDVARFQEEYNRYVGQGNKLQVDGKLGEQTATAMLMFTDPDAPVVPAEDKSKKDEPAPTKTTTPEDFSETAEVRKGIDGAVIASLGQLVPVGMVIGDKYKEDSKLPRMQYAGNVGAGSVRGGILPRVNMNAERAAAERNTVAIKNAIQNTNAGPGAIAAMMAANTAQGNQMLAIANQEQEANKQLSAEEARMGQQASQFNVSKGLEAGMANVRNKLTVDQANLEAGIQEVRLRNAEKQYGREERFGAYDAAAARMAGIYKDKRAYDTQEKVAKAIDNTGSYERFNIYEQLKKQSKNKNSPYYGRSDKELKRIARNTYLKSLDDLDAETAKVESNKKKLGGARKYTSRLGELSKRKKSFNI